jgi:hypothetical protein
VAALVVEDQPGVGAVPVGRRQFGGEGAALEGPGGHRQRVAVHEDDGQRRVLGPDLVDGQQHAVVGPHERRAVGRAGGGAEGVVLPQLRVGQLRPDGVRRELLGADPAGGDPADRHARRRPRRGETDDRADDARGAAPAVGGLRLLAAGHQTAPAEPT